MPTVTSGMLAFSASLQPQPAAMQQSQVAGSIMISRCTTTGTATAVWNVHVIAGLNSHMWVEFNLVQGERVLQGNLMGVGKTAWQGSTLGLGAELG